MAVRPIQSPISARRASSEGIAKRTGETGWYRTIPAVHADSMNSPRPAASLRYSGQCRAKAAFIDTVRHAGKAAGFANPDRDAGCPKLETIILWRNGDDDPV